MRISTVFFGGSLALALIGSAVAAAPPAISVYGKAFYNSSTLLLNVFADSTVELRSFGIQVGYDSSRVQLASVASDDTLWFLSARPGLRSVYTPSQLMQSAVRIVGARFQGDQTQKGVTGTQLLLASLTFQRLTGDLPDFQLALAGPVNYTSFVTIEGANVDRSVDGLGKLVLSFEVLSEDSDQDGIPDQVEFAWFGNLTRANATTDSDGDGVTDLDEWIAGTNAADPTSLTRLVLTLQPDGTRYFSWDGRPGRVYDLLWSGDLTNFVPIAEGLTPESPNSFLDTVNGDQGFYRLRMHKPTLGQ
ncbi:MAG: hypothetical protein NTW21_09925 [Verrucomicrobia bacterium]|nr:hypothetical protein [Verrucomicrobiota bacterium]